MGRLQPSNRCHALRISETQAGCAPLRQRGMYCKALPTGRRRCFRCLRGFGLDVIALVGASRHTGTAFLRSTASSSLGVSVSERTVTNLLDLTRGLVAIRLSDRRRLKEAGEDGQVVLAIDGLQPDVGHEVLWVVRECLSGRSALARSLLSGTQKSLVGLLREVADGLEVPVVGIVSDGQHPDPTGRGEGIPESPSPAVPVPLPKRGSKGGLRSRPPRQEGAKEAGARGEAHRARAGGREDAQAEALRGYCLAVRSAITDDGRPALCLGHKASRPDRGHPRVHRAGRQKGASEGARACLRRMLVRALAQTAPLWGLSACAIGGYIWAAHPEKRSCVRRSSPKLPELLSEMGKRGERMQSCKEPSRCS